MKITIIAVGTRGDVEPHLALGRGLAARGHRVTVAAPIDFESQTKALGLGFHPISVRFRDLFGSNEGAALLAGSNQHIRMIRQMKRVAERVARQVFADIGDACHGAEAISYSILGMSAHFLARDLGVPSVATLLQPLGRTRHWPSPLLSPRGEWPRSLNFLSHLVLEQVFWLCLRALLRASGRRALPIWGPIGDVYRTGTPMLFAYSPSLMPRPADYAPSMHVTGFWTLPRDTGWTPPASLADFLAGGAPPVCVGFGSMNSGRIDSIVRAALEAIAASGHRALVLTGWWENALRDQRLGDNVHVAADVPHDWLFPRVAAAIHHGGAGTTAAALRAAVPSVVTPLFFDQWFWGHRLHRQGLGPAPIAFRDVTARSLHAALDDALHAPLARRAIGDLSRRLCAEDGVGTAVRVLEQACGGGAIASLGAA